MILQDVARYADMPPESSETPRRIAALCFLASIAWVPLIYIHVLSLSTDLLTSITERLFFGTIIGGAILGIAIAITGAVAAWFRPSPFGRSVGISAACLPILAVLGTPGYALIAPVVAARFAEWHAFGWSQPVWTRTLHRVRSYAPFDSHGTRSYRVGIDPYGEWEEVPISAADFATLAAADRPDHVWNYCVEVSEQRSGGVARMLHESQRPYEGASRIARCPAVNS